MHLFYNPEATSNILPLEESQHATRVLRLRQGDPIEITDGAGSFFGAFITKADPNASAYEITRQTKVPPRPYSIHLAIAPAKQMDRMEWMVEKCTEVGMDRISFIECKTSERKTIQLERLKKITVNAMKQSRQAWLPILDELITFSQFINKNLASQRIIAVVDDTNPHHLSKLAKPNGDYLILIGPEGDFSSEEIELALKNGFQKASLGSNRLRTETAGLYAVMALNILNQKSHI